MGKQRKPKLSRKTKSSRKATKPPKQSRFLGFNNAPSMLGRTPIPNVDIRQAERIFATRNNLNQAKSELKETKAKDVKSKKDIKNLHNAANDADKVSKNMISKMEPTVGQSILQHGVDAAVAMPKNFGMGLGAKILYNIGTGQPQDFVRDSKIAAAISAAGTAMTGAKHLYDYGVHKALKGVVSKKNPYEMNYSMFSAHNSNTFARRVGDMTANNLAQQEERRRLHANMHPRIPGPDPREPVQRQRQITLM